MSDDLDFLELPKWFITNIQTSWYVPGKDKYIRSEGSVDGVHIVGCKLCDWKESQPPSDKWFDVANHFEREHNELVVLLVIKEMDK